MRCSVSSMQTPIRLASRYRDARTANGVSPHSLILGRRCRLSGVLDCAVVQAELVLHPDELVLSRVL
jgi:hypothetical protein